MATHAVQPFAWDWQVSTPAAPQRVAPAEHALVQHVAWPAAPVQAPLVHGVVTDLKMQPWLSCEQVASVDVFWHVAPATLPQVASVLHEHLALPAAPVQLWLVPQATGVPYDKQPLVPSVQVARPPLMQDVCPIAQLFEQVSEHWEPGAFPEQVCGAAHCVVDATNGHESVSTEHAATVWPSWQAVPAPVQIEAAQVQAAALADMAQVWCGPQVFVVVQAVHPFACNWQV